MNSKWTASLVCLLVLAAWAELPEPEPVAVEQPMRIGLSLSGGAALGLAHIGVLKVLEREGIPVVAIAGTSMGSLVGGVYAAGYSATQIESLALHADWDRLFSSAVPFGAQYLPERQQAQRYMVQLRHKNLVPALPGGLVPLQNVEFLLMRLLSNAEYNTGYDLDSLPIPYRAAAVDLKSGKLQVMRKVRLEQAIRASIAIPGVFSPEKLDDMELVDGGVQRLLPVDALDSIDPNLDLRIAVLTMKHNPETGVSLIDITSRSMDLVGQDELLRQKERADVLIEPNVDPFTHSDFAKAAGLIAAGESAAEAALPRIRELVGTRTPSRHRNTLTTRPAAVVRTVKFEGLHVTREATVRAEVWTRPGDTLRFSRLIDDLTRLFNTGLFEDVNYRLEPAGSQLVNVIMEVEERPYGFYSFGLRYDIVDRLALGLEVGQGNLGGSGAGVRMAMDLGNPNEVRFGLTGTRLFGLPFGYRLDGYGGSVERSYYEEGRRQGIYTVGYRGGAGEAGYVVGRDAFFVFGLNGYRATYAAVGSLRDSLHAEWVVGPSFRFEANTFRDVDFPTAGTASRLELRSSIHSMNGTRQFVRVGYSYQRVSPVNSWLLLRSALDVGTSFGELAWAEHFRTGGVEFVGFEPDEFTSEWRAIARLGADFRLFRLFGQESYPVYLQVTGNAGTFVSWGELFATPDVPSLLHWGVGVGARTNTPIGPVQLVVGAGDFGLRPAEWPVTAALFFSVGREFRYTR